MAIFRIAEKQSRGIKALFASQREPAVAGVFSSIIGKRELPKMPGTIIDGVRERTGAKLSDLKPGETGVVARLTGNAQGRLRLMEMGLTPGAEVKVIHAAAFGGPLQITVRGYQLSLRRQEASAVVLE